MIPRPIPALIATALCLAYAAFGSGSREPAGRNERDRQAPRLAEAKPNVKADLDGYTIRTAAHWLEPDPRSVVGRAVLDAWKKVEAEYGVTHRWIQMPNPDATIEKLTATVLLGEPFAEIVWLRPSASIPALVEANMILPLDGCFDFNDPRWPRQNREIAEYKGRMYGVVPWMLAGGQGIWYNRTLFQREGLADLQELQRRGEWTWGKYLEIARAATRDSDGDGKTDQWGIAVGYEIEYPLIYSNGARVVKKNADGAYRFSLTDPEAIEALEFISELYRSGTLSFEGEALFIAGRAAMYGGATFQGHNMLMNMQDDYGFVYYPRGPAVAEYQCVASSSDVEMMVFPANLNYPPYRLGEIVTRTTPFQVVSQIRKEFLEGHFRFKQDMDQQLEMIDRTEFTRTDSFPGLRQVVGQIFREIRKGTSAAIRASKTCCGSMIRRTPATRTSSGAGIAPRQCPPGTRCRRHAGSGGRPWSNAWRSCTRCVFRNATM
jgi:ABC-type glycerol-3-phosphate transport system substrate-binding protein